MNTLPLRAEEGMALAPLVVDLDGTLTLTDTLWESVVRAWKAQPSSLLRMPLWLWRGRAFFKDRVAALTTCRVDLLPLNDALMEYLGAQREQGRAVILATAANQRIARAFADYHKLFDDVIASNEEHNLKGAAKLAAIRERVGDRFVYVGDSHADLPIWRAAEAAVFAGVSPAVRRALNPDVKVERDFPRPRAGWTTWRRALRMHQWLKNLLVFVPLLTSFSFSAQAWTAATVAFLAFSAVASATYLVNDLFDLDNDRQHERKRHRPLASAIIAIPHAALASFLLLGVGFGIGAILGLKFTLLLSLYVVATSAYSWVLKRYMLADVLSLAFLYTLRIFAGGVALGVQLTSWLLAFSAFLFLSLALIKRCAELVTLESQGLYAAAGRGYAVDDLRVLWPLGTSAGMAAVIVFGLFISAETTRQRYASPEFMWGAGFALVYWLARLWVKTSRGEMHDDPIVYALKDTNSRVTVGFMVGATLAAYLLELP